MPIHPTAIVNPDAKVHLTVDIGPYAVIDGMVEIGPRSSVAAFARITGNTSIGANCRIHSGAIVGDTPQDRTYDGGDSYCVVGDGTVIREGATIHRGTKPGSTTVVGKNCFIMVNSHVGHDCVLEEGVILTNGALLGGYVSVGRRAFISGNAGIHQFVRIGELAMVGGLAKVTQDIPPFFMVDRDGTCVGVNRIGMNRAEMSAEERNDIREAFGILYSVSCFRDAIDKLAATLTTDAGRRFLDFLREPSSRGIARRAQSQRMGEAPSPVESKYVPLVHHFDEVGSTGMHR